jgi:hypothetical protein
MDHHNGQTPHPESPAEGATTADSFAAGTHAANEKTDTPTDDSPIGGDETTEDQLSADNPVEESTLRTLDPDDTPA